jgi:hypothetical protein
MAVKPAPEPWDPDRFVACFDEVAKSHKEWGFEKTSDRIALARQLYEMGRHGTLAEFAQAWFDFERRS